MRSSRDGRRERRGRSHPRGHAGDLGRDGDRDAPEAAAGRVREPRAAHPAELRAVVQLLQEKTLPSVLGSEGAEQKAKLWMSWVDDGRS